MNLLFRSVLVIFVLLNFGGCAMTPEERMATYEPGGKLAYTSILGNSFGVVVTGTTIFNNDSNQFDVSDWRIDEKITDEIINSSKDSKFEFERLSDLDSFKLSLISKGSAEPNILLQDVKEQGADFLVVLVPERQAYTHQGDFFNNSTTQYLKGFGITKLSKLGNELKTSIYSSVKTYIYDLNSMEEIGSSQTVGMRFSKVLHQTKFDNLKKDDAIKTKEELLDMMATQAKNQLRDLWLCGCW